MGFREASLTWNEKNFLAAGAGQNADCGLTKTGADCIKKMDELGMLVDLAHTNQKTFWDILEISQKPMCYYPWKLQQILFASEKLY